jgi:hypothetical protein
MEGGLVQHVHAEGGAFWRFKHPTIGDAFAALIVQSPELLGIYLQGTPPEDMVGQITCGDAGIERAVLIPKALFPVVIARLDEFSADSRYKSTVFAKWGAQSGVRRFLAHRCSSEFLAEYVDKHPELLNDVALPGLFLDSVPEVILAEKLHECGLLPEDKRKKFVATVTEYAVEGQDLQGLENPYVRGVFTEEEFGEMRSRIREEVLPRLADIRLDWELNERGDQSADEYMQPLLDSFEILKREFGPDDEVVAAIERQIDHVNVWVGERIPGDPEDDGGERRLGNVKTTDASHSGRSVFDDVDA